MQVIEIGPGGGVLTLELVRSGARVWAFEVDLEWAFYLRRAGRAAPEPASPDSPDSPASQAADGAGLHVLACDAVQFPWASLAGLQAATYFTGNLPFNVGTRLVDDTLDLAASDPRRFPRLGYMVQKEVADRLVAGPGDPAYGALSVLVAARAQARTLGRLAPGAFRPPPKVSAAFVGLLPRTPAVPASEWPGFRQLVFAAFARRRKTVVNSLSSRWPKAEALAMVAEAGIDPGARAESLDLDQFLGLHRAWREKSRARGRIEGRLEMG